MSTLERMSAGLASLVKSMPRVTAIAVAALLCCSLPAALQAQGVPAPGQGAARFTAEQVKAAVADHVQAQLAAGGGVYRLSDGKSGKELELEFVDVALVALEPLSRIHDPGRNVDGSSYFACVNFHPVGAPKEKLYDVDLSLAPRGGALEVIEVHVHKEPRLVNGQWVKVPRDAGTK